MTVVGELALWIALFLAAWATVAFVVARVLRRPELAESGTRAIFAATAMTALSCGGLWVAMLRHDFALDYVAAHTTMNTPTHYLVTAFWGGRAGRLLWLALALAVCISVALARQRRDPDPATRSGLGAELAPLLLMALASVCLVWSPFGRVEWVPADGRGLAPALQNPWAAPHFVTLFPAYAAATVGVVVAIAPARRRDGEALTVSVRGWLLATWCLMTAAIAFRMRWSYLEPALGGSWTWDVGQSANMVVWLAVTALVRSLLVRRPRAASDPRGPRIAGMYVVYVGAAMLVVGLAARHYWRDESIRLQPGQAAAASDPYRGRWRFVSQGPSRDERVNYLSTAVGVEAWRGGASAGIIAAERRQYLDSAQRPVSEPAMKPGIRSFLWLDLYVLLADLRGDLAQLRVSFRPLVSLVWLGWALVFAGAIGVTAQLMARARSSPHGARGAAA